MAALASDWLSMFDFSSETADRKISIMVAEIFPWTWLYFLFIFISSGFSSPEPKAHVSYCHSSSSVVNPSVCRSSSVNLHAFDFSSKISQQNSTKLERKRDLNVLYNVCAFRADGSNKIATLASDWLRYFPLLFWSRWMEFNKTWQEAWSQRPLPSLCFSGRSQNRMAALASDWLRHFPLLLWNRRREFNKNDRKQDHNVLYQVLCSSGRSEQQDGRPRLWLAETF